MTNSILDKYLEYINSVSDEQLMSELLKSGIEHYLVETQEDYVLPSFTSNETASYQCKVTEANYSIKVTASQHLNAAYIKKAFLKMDKECA